MSDTVANIEKRIRTLTKDNDPGDYTISSMRTWSFIDHVAQGMASRLGMGQSWATSAFTMVVGQADYTLSAEYAEIVLLKDATDNSIIRRYTNQQMERFRVGTTIARGIPYAFSLLESTAQVLTVRLYPTPGVTDPVDVLSSAVPARITASTDSIPFARDLITALEYKTAAMCLAAMTADQRAALLLGDGLAPAWAAEAEALIKSGGRRVSQLKRPGWVQRVSA